jgi:uncharacterized membrane-anchored protein YitT (DUF2179 family)
MKRPVRKILSFFAFNLLFFALYLNFIHKDKAVMTVDESGRQKVSVTPGTALVDNAEKNMDKKTEATVTIQQPVSKAEALR